MLPYFAIFIGIAILGGIFVFASRISARQRIWFSLPNGNMVPIGGKFSGHIIISRTPHLITSVILRLEPSAEDRSPFIVKEMLSAPAKADEDLAIPFSLQIPDKLDDGSPIDGVRQLTGFVNAAALILTENRHGFFMWKRMLVTTSFRLERYLSCLTNDQERLVLCQPRRVTIGI